MGMFTEKLDKIVSTEVCMDKKGEEKADNFHSVNMKVAKHSFKRAPTEQETDEFYGNFTQDRDYTTNF